MDERSPTAPERLASDSAEGSLGATRDLAVTEADPGSAADRPVSPVATPGQRIGRYFVLDTLGRGAMGVVVRAFDPELERAVALKVVNPRYLAERDAEEARARLVSEARAQARLSHPNVTAIYDVGTHGEHVYLAMELVEGGSVAAWLRAERRSWREVVPVFRAAAEGLAAAHAAGLVHRDIKPSNILMGEDGRVRITDFGIARMGPGAATSSPTDSDLGPTDAGLTEAGFVVGTPAYMAPEQHGGQTVGPAADQYALCISLYEALHGRRPFGGDVRLMIRAKHEGALPEFDDEAVPRWLQVVIRRGLHPRPDGRYPDLRALIAALDDDPARRRRHWWLGLGAIGVLGVAAAGWIQAVRSSTPCAGVGDGMAEVWGEGPRAEVEQAFTDSGRPYAAATFERVAAVLDQRAHDWVQMRRDACEATEVRHEQSDALLDRRMACLDRRLEQTRALVEVLRRADGEVVDRSLDAVAKLRGLARCADADALQAQVPPPEGEQARAEAEGILAVLADAEAHRDAGRYEAGLQVAQAARARADALGHPPVQAEAMLVEAGLLEDQGQSSEAVARAKESLWVAQGAGDDQTVVDAAAYLVWLTAEREGEPEIALDWLRYAQATLQRVGEDEWIRGNLLMYEGVALVGAGRYEEARAAYERALVHYREHFGDDHPMVAKVVFNLGALFYLQGHLDEALAQFREANARIIETHGAEHPRVAFGHEAMGTVLQGLGRLDEAETEYERAIELIGRTLGSDHRDAVSPIINLAHVYDLQGQRDGAEQLYLKALARFEDDANHSHLAVLLNNLGMHYGDGGDPEKGLPYIRQAIEKTEARLGPDHPDLIHPLSGLGRILTGLEQTEQALEAFERQRQLAMASLGDDHRMVGVALADMGNALKIVGREPEALERYRASLAVFERNPDSTPTDLVVARLDVARLLLDMRRYEDALPLLERAWQATVEGDVLPQAQIDAHVDLARGLVLAKEDLPRARRLGEQALVLLDELGSSGEEQAEQLREWLAALPGE